jgi:hypothetical protein
MAVNQIDNAAKLGKLLQIIYSNGVVNQLSEDFRDWDAVSKLRVSEEAARSINFTLQTGYGPRSTGWSRQGVGANFKSSQQSNTSEKSAGFNQMDSTIELEYDLWQRALGTPAKYAEPLALEINNKAIIQKRLLSSVFHRDGSGLLAISEAAAPTKQAVGSSFLVRVSMDGVSGADATGYNGGGSRYAEYQDGHIMCAIDGSIATLATAAVFEVVSKNRRADYVDYKVLDSAGAELNEAAVDAVISAMATTAFYVYRENQPTRPDLSSGIVSLGEINNISEVMPGLESLFAADGRTLHGIDMIGATAGTQYDASGDPIDIRHLDEGLSELKVIVGQGKYKYNQLLCTPEGRSALIDSQEQDRRLQALTDDKRGFKGFGYVHDNDTLELSTSEFCKKESMWVMPQGGKEKGVIELHGKDFKPVQVGSQDTFLGLAGGNHAQKVNKYMLGYMTLLSKHPAATLKIKNFTES